MLNQPQHKPWLWITLDIALAVLIFFVALGPRLDAAQAYSERPQSEEKLYDRYAWAWAQGLGEEPREKVFPWHPLASFTHRPPLYSLFLGTVYRVAGHDFSAAREVQAYLGALLCVLTFVLGRQIGGRWVGLGAGLLMAQYSFLIGFVPRLMSETLFIVLMLAAMSLLLWMRNGHLGLVFAAGIMLGLANLTRPVLLLPWIPLLIGWMWFAPALRRRIIWAVAALGVGMSLIILPVTWRNYQFHGEFVLISSNSGYTFYHGVARAKSVLTNFDALTPKETIDDLELGELKSQDAYREAAIAYLRQYPQDILPIMYFQAEEFWHAKQGYKISDLVIPVPEDPWFWPLLGLVGLASLPFFPRRAFHARSLLYLNILSQVVMGLIFHMEVRYRLPLAPMLAVLGCWLVWNVALWTVELARRARPAAHPTTSQV